MSLTVTECMELGQEVTGSARRHVCDIVVHSVHCAVCLDSGLGFVLDETHSGQVMHMVERRVGGLRLAILRDGRLEILVCLRRRTGVKKWPTALMPLLLNVKRVEWVE